MFFGKKYELMEQMPQTKTRQEQSDSSLNPIVILTKWATGIPGKQPIKLSFCLQDKPP